MTNLGCNTRLRLAMDVNSCNGTMKNTEMLSMALSDAVVWQSSSQSNRVTRTNAVRSQALQSFSTQCRAGNHPQSTSIYCKNTVTAFEPLYSQHDGPQSTY